MEADRQNDSGEVRGHKDGKNQGAEASTKGAARKADRQALN